MDKICIGKLVLLPRRGFRFISIFSMCKECKVWKLTVFRYLYTLDKFKNNLFLIFLHNLTLSGLSFQTWGGGILHPQ